MLPAGLLSPPYLSLLEQTDDEKIISILPYNLFRVFMFRSGGF
jgi:hypothetical protein